MNQERVHKKLLVVATIMFRSHSFVRIWLAISLLVNHTGAIYYGEDEYPHEYNDEIGTGMISNCAFAGRNGKRYDEVTLDPSRNGDHVVTSIEANILGSKTEVTGRYGKDRLQKKDKGLPYFYNPQFAGQPFYLQDVVGACNPATGKSFDLFAVKYENRHLLLKTGSSFSGRNKSFDDGGVEKFPTEALGDVLYTGQGKLMSRGNWRNLRSDQKKTLSKLSDAAILVNMKCQVEPQPFRFADIPRKPWKKYAVSGDSLPNVKDP